MFHIYFFIIFENAGCKHIILFAKSFLMIPLKKKNRKRHISWLRNLGMLLSFTRLANDFLHIWENMCHLGWFTHRDLRRYRRHPVKLKIKAPCMVKRPLHWIPENRKWDSQSHAVCQHSPLHSVPYCSAFITKSNKSPCSAEKSDLWNRRTGKTEHVVRWRQ